MEPRPLHWGHVDIDPRIPEIPTLVSLSVIVVILTVVTVASLVKTRRDPSMTAHAGALHARRTSARPDSEGARTDAAAGR